MTAAQAFRIILAAGMVFILALYCIAISIYMLAGNIPSWGAMYFFAHATLGVYMFGALMVWDIVSQYRKETKDEESSKEKAN